MNMRNKIKAILAKAASTESEAEAAIFLAKAETLMEEHQIGAFELGEHDPIGVSEFFHPGSGPLGYKGNLLQALANYYGCRGVYRRSRAQFRTTLVGPESARVTTELMTDFVWDEVGKQATKIAKETGFDRGAMRRRIANAMIIRVARMAGEAKTPMARTAAAASHALIVIDQTDALYEEMFPDVKNKKAVSLQAGALAHKAAADINLHRQTTGASQLKIGK